MFNFRNKQEGTKDTTTIVEAKDIQQTSDETVDTNQFILVDGEEREIDDSFEKLFDEIEDEQSGENNLEVIVDSRVQKDIKPAEDIGLEPVEPVEPTEKNNILDNDLSDSLLSNIAKGNIGTLEDTVIKLENLKGYLISQLNVDRAVDRELNCLFSSVIEHDNDKFNSTQMSFYEYVGNITILFNRLLDKELPVGKVEFQRYSYEDYILKYYYLLEDELVDTLNTIFLEFQTNILNVDSRVRKSDKVKDTICNTLMYEGIVDISNNRLNNDVKKEISIEQLFKKVSEYVNLNHKK